MNVFLDVNIIMYAAGATHPSKAPCSQLLERIAQGGLAAVCDTEVLQELLYRYWHVKVLEEGLKLVAMVTRIIPTILPVSKADVLLATKLLVQHRRVQPRDAIHAAVMLNHGLTHLYSYDRDFDLIPGLKRLEP